jgi:hypothetical protein
MKCDFHHILYKRTLLGVRAPHSLETAKKVLERHLQDGASEELEEIFRSTRKATVLSYEELRDLADLGPRSAHMA